MEKAKSNLPSLSEFLNLDNPVNPVYSLIGFHCDFNNAGKARS
jgi:hypothetical protein